MRLSPGGELLNPAILHPMLRTLYFLLRTIPKIVILVLVWQRVTWPEFVLLFYLFAGNEALAFDLSKLKRAQGAFIASVQALVTEALKVMGDVSARGVKR